MENTITIQLTNEKAIGLLHEMEELHLIKVIKENIVPSKTKLSDKYRGVFSKKDALDFNKHTMKMRKELANT
ncbi:hypothetical protein [Mucilaginibacter gotjawali]|uniref:Uncharacterized protein n=2 Tax=Mucilaginibacter gotjawali TaxID=1550579 RepID=A0A839SLD2_9SPHI|nr:hypothetical protein [Mucilaginibacter gotjawali]MBB3058113.1 hypothetical protein [Mucilaginibacter gotjawali]BAU52088.1 hypothetical protein MgSA37_00238 [Mucilaginibacter gotjawali]